MLFAKSPYAMRRDLEFTTHDHIHGHFMKDFLWQKAVQLWAMEFNKMSVISKHLILVMDVDGQDVVFAPHVTHLIGLVGHCPASRKR